MLDQRAMLGSRRERQQIPLRARGLESDGPPLASRAREARGVTAPRIANIGARQVRRRRTLGIVSAVVAGLLGFLLVEYEAPTWTRILLFLPLWIAGLGVFQAREKT